MDHIWLLSFFLSVKICQIQPFRGQRSVGTWVIEAAEFKFEVRSDLRGHREAATASAATMMAVSDNMDINARVVEVACIKSEVKFDLQGH